MTSTDSSEYTKPEEVERRIVRSWRRLTGGGTRRDQLRRTLVACSGGQDSIALAGLLSEAAPSGTIVIGHVLHDLRERAVCLRDRDAAQELASRMQSPFVCREVEVAAMPGNDEANARKARYAALEEMAAQTGCRYVATAHHAEDQLETCLLALVRGAGPRGLAGMSPTRELSETMQLIRPALSTRRAELHRVCERLSLSWCEDESNQDRTRDRARLRASVIPELFSMREGLPERLADQSETFHAAAEALEREAERFLECAELQGGSSWCWSRDQLRSADRGTLAAALRLGVRHLTGGSGMDALSLRSVTRAVEAAQDPSGESKHLILSAACLKLTRDSATLSLQAPTTGG